MTKPNSRSPSDLFVTPRQWWLLLIAMVFFGSILTGCATIPTHPTLQQAQLPDLIPLRHFFLNVETNYDYKVSPDGTKLAWIAVKNRRLTIFFKTIGGNGVTGYGRALMEAAVGEFAGKMHDDLIDGVEWAVKNGIADPEKICIAGGSYGGYATLVGLTFTPDAFACGVDLVGMSNLVSLLESAPPYWKLGMPRWHKYVGDSSRPEDLRRMEAKSPLFRADQVKRPLLIIHAANDARVKQQESDQMVAALRKAGKEVEYVVFPDEGHVRREYGNWKNILRLYRAIEEFLARHLGGTSAGFDYYELGFLLF